MNNDDVSKRIENAKALQRKIDRAGGVNELAREAEDIKKIVERHINPPSTSSTSSLADTYNEMVDEVTDSSAPTAPSFRLDIRQADAKYKSFPSFDEWLKCSVDSARWDRYTAILIDWGEISPDLLKRARNVVTRAAAIETGALEQLYEVDRGFTFTVATQAAMWEAKFNEKEPETRALIESQMQAYDLVLDLATQNRPIAEAWIRSLHEEICSSQETYTAYTEIGLQELMLPRGQYKELPNHVLGRDGKVHSYAPVDLTPTEMHKLTEELRSEVFLAAHPILQASYAHYAFVLIHPFADGNGRVARALASIFTYRAQSIPLLILMENRNEYLAALAKADEGNYQAFVDFTLERALDAIRLTEESLRTADTTPLEDALFSFRRLFVTKGGYTHAEVDEAGYRLIHFLSSEIQRQIGDMGDFQPLQIRNKLLKSSKYPLLHSDTSRYPVAQDGGRILSLVFSSPDPTPVNISLYIFIEVPVDCGLEDDIIIWTTNERQPFVARITELMPSPTAALQMRLSMFARAILSKGIMMVTEEAAIRLKEIGYRPAL